MIVSEPVIRMENIIKRYYIGKPNELQILNGIACQSIRENLSPSSVSPVPEKVH